MKRSVFGIRFAILALVVSCGSSDSGSGEPSTESSHDAGGAATSHTNADAGGSHPAAVLDAGGSSPVATAHPDASGSSPSGSTATDAATPSGHADASAPAGTGDAGATSSGTTLTGTLGALGAAMPIVSSLVIFTGSETIVYLSSAPVECSRISGRNGSKWLGSLPAGSQVVELVVQGAAKVGAATLPEVNYAPGGMSSAYEKNATLGSGKVSFTKAEAMGVVEGTFSATYSNPTGNVSGTFHAEFCADGQEY